MKFQEGDAVVVGRDLYILVAVAHNCGLWTAYRQKLKANGWTAEVTRSVGVFPDLLVKKRGAKHYRRDLWAGMDAIPHQR